MELTCEGIKAKYVPDRAALNDFNAGAALGRRLIEKFEAGDKTAENIFLLRAFILHKRLIVIYFMLFISGGSAIFTAIFINL